MSHVVRKRAHVVKNGVQVAKKRAHVVKISIDVVKSEKGACLRQKNQQ